MRVLTGLSSAEAARRLSQFGPNAVSEEHVGPAQRILWHFWAPVPWMLEATIALQLAIGEWVEALLIAVLLVINVVLGVFQESRADAALALLKQRLALRVRAKRDGDWREMAAAELVPGDIVQVSLGAIVPADLRLVSGVVLLDQSMLTVESLPAEIGSGRLCMPGRWYVAARWSALERTPISAVPRSWSALGEARNVLLLPDCWMVTTSFGGPGTQRFPYPAA